MVKRVDEYKQLYLCKVITLTVCISTQAKFHKNRSKSLCIGILHGWSSGQEVINTWNNVKWRHQGSNGAMQLFSWEILACYWARWCDNRITDLSSFAKDKSGEVIIREWQMRQWWRIFVEVHIGDLVGCRIASKHHTSISYTCPIAQWPEHKQKVGPTVFHYTSDDGLKAI